MAKFFVSVSTKNYYHLVVRADNSEEAIAKARKALRDARPNLKPDKVAKGAYPHFEFEGGVCLPDEDESKIDVE